MADDAAAAAAAAASAAAAAAGQKPWYQGVAGVDEAMVGHWTNKGWAGKPAAEVAVEATKAWKAAEVFVGVPSTQLLRMPKDASDEATAKTMWERLGKPVDAKGYDFSEVKYTDGKPLEEGFANAVREASFGANLPKDAARSLARAFAKYLDNTKMSEAAERTAKLAEQRQALKTNWGPNEAANTFVAQRAAAALGIAPETVSALEAVIGYDKIMEMFRAIGSKIGEDKFITGTSAGGGGPMTREAAVAKKADLMGDKAWTKSYLEGDAAKKREMLALNIIISGDSGQARAA